MPEIQCPECGGPGRAMATRQAPDNAIRRWRACTWCGATFTTYERVHVLERNAVAGEPMMSVMDAAKRLGIRKTSVYQQIRAGAIPAWRLGDRIWVPERWVEQMIADRRAKTTLTASTV